MKHYIDRNTNEIYAYESDGSQDEFIKPGLELLSDAELLILRPPVDPNITIMQQIAALEMSMTPRRIRDAFSSESGKAWILDVEAQIAALRAGLV